MIGIVEVAGTDAAPGSGVQAASKAAIMMQRAVTSIV
jgi:hypothetical protein